MDTSTPPSPPRSMVETEPTTSNDKETVHITVCPPPLTTFEDKEEKEKNNSTDEFYKNTQAEPERYGEIPKGTTAIIPSKNTIFYRPPQKYFRQSTEPVENHPISEQIRRFSADKEHFPYDENMGNIKEEKISPFENRNERIPVTTTLIRPKYRHPIFASAEDLKYEQKLSEELSLRNISPDNNRVIYSSNENRYYQSPTSSMSPRSADGRRRLSDSERSINENHINRNTHYEYMNNFNDTQNSYRKTPPRQTHTSEVRPTFIEKPTMTNSLLNIKVLEKTENFVTLYVEVNGRKYEGRLSLDSDKVAM